MWCPIHSFSEDLNEGRDLADDAFTGTLFQSQTDDGKEFRYVSLFTSDTELFFFSSDREHTFTVSETFTFRCQTW